MNNYIKTLLIGTLLSNANFALAADQSNTENAKIIVAADQTMEQSMGASTKTGRKNMAHKGLFDSKVMDTNGDGIISKEEYTAHHEKAYGEMKQTNGGVSIKEMNAAMNHGSTKANKLQPSSMDH
jgi:hypothetical protein